MEEDEDQTTYETHLRKKCVTLGKDKDHLLLHPISKETNGRNNWPPENAVITPLPRFLVGHRLLHRLKLHLNKIKVNEHKNGLGHCGALRNPYEMWTRVVSKEMEGWAHRLLDIGNNETRHGIEAVQHQSVAAPVDDGVGRDLRSALTTRNLSLAVRSGISRLFGFPSKSAYFAFWKKLFLFDVVANVARVGGSLFLYVFAPHLYQSLPGGLIG
ncbi:hypothetical protein OUZ56_005900 [Daphnia magna]|uniref:Uncharacterized protein n=1 Tax=Daphnia magna TaxID=35525 RepID=A0ABQ9YU28_9CRUS|nr:hypothetical protein OUZ56_005900 [Daphnia magna]